MSLRARPVLEAPAAWRCIDIISDLHLDAEHPDTFVAWQDYLLHTPAQAVFILGDLFEVWVGDDALSLDPAGFEARCAGVLRAAARRCDIFFMCGNRDFLVGSGFAQATGVGLLDDPTALQFAGARWLLSHGDALCLADTDYQQFRGLVRGAQWQHDFLQQPLADRRAMARELRQRSEARKQQAGTWVDLDAAEVSRVLHEAGAITLIHGHTHQPAEHVPASGLRRIVLSDWDMQALPPRGEILRIDGQGQHRRLAVTLPTARRA